MTKLKHLLIAFTVIILLPFMVWMKSETSEEISPIIFSFFKENTEKFLYIAIGAVMLALFCLLYFVLNKVQSAKSSSTEVPDLEETDF